MHFKRVLYKTAKLNCKREGRLTFRLAEFGGRLKLTGFERFAVQVELIRVPVYIAAHPRVNGPS